MLSVRVGEKGAVNLRNKSSCRLERFIHRSPAKFVPGARRTQVMSLTPAGCSVVLGNSSFTELDCQGAFRRRQAAFAGQPDPPVPHLVRSHSGEKVISGSSLAIRNRAAALPQPQVTPWGRDGIPVGQAPLLPSDLICQCAFRRKLLPPRVRLNPPALHLHSGAEKAS